MTLEEAEKRTEEARAYLHIDEKIAELANLDSRIANPDFWNDTDNAQRVSKQASDIRDVIERYESACGLLDDIKTATELAEEDPEFGEEIENDLERLEKMLDDFEVESWFNGRFDSSDAILSIHPGSGSGLDRNAVSHVFALRRFQGLEGQGSRSGPWRRHRSRPRKHPN